MLIFSGKIQSIRKYETINVIIIATQLPRSRAFCTFDSVALLSEILTNKVPIIDEIIPTPAITIGKIIGPILLKES